MKSVIKRATNEFLSNFGLQIVRTQKKPDLKPFDEQFLQWISEAEALGKDPNDVADMNWGNPLVGAEKYLFPHISKDSIVLELGPGTGRLTRHIIGRCKRMILVDYSDVVCDWLNKYLPGKGDFCVHKIGGPELREIGDSQVHMSFADGVLEHIDMDDAYEFLKEFHRVLRPGGVFWFNFDTLVTPGGLEWFRQQRSYLRPGVRSIFRFYHPEDMQRLAEDAGFNVVDVNVHFAADRQILISLRKPDA
jgi:ubiquinone/menaquinone biosynthesis C-methylase UbiE